MFLTAESFLTKITARFEENVLKTSDIPKYEMLNLLSAKDKYRRKLIRYLVGLAVLRVSQSFFRI